MTRTLSALIVSAAFPTLLMAQPPAKDAPSPGAKISFYKEVRPIFQQQCQGCHQPAKPGGGFVMTSFPDLFKAGDSDLPGVVVGMIAAKMGAGDTELRETLTLRLLGEGMRFSDDELHAVVSLLAGPGVVWELKFGSWVLLQPERINAYAQAVIQTMREDEHERGCLPEERVLNGDLTYHSSIARLEADEERFVLLAMHQTLVERGLCLREHTHKGALLVFPS